MLFCRVVESFCPLSYSPSPLKRKHKKKLLIFLSYVSVFVLSVLNICFDVLLLIGNIFVKKEYSTELLRSFFFRKIKDCENQPVLENFFPKPSEVPTNHKTSNLVFISPIELKVFYLFLREDGKDMRERELIIFSCERGIRGWLAGKRNSKK